MPMVLDLFVKIKENIKHYNIICW